MRVLLLVSLMFSFASMAEIKVAVVNVQKIVASIKQGKKVIKTLESSYNSKKKQLKGEEDKIKKMQKDFQKKAAVLSEKAKLKKEKEVQTAILALQKKTMDYQKNIQKQEAELRKPILEKLKGVIDKISKDEGVDLTFEVATSPLVFAKNSVDISAKVIKAYDKKYK